MTKRVAMFSGCLLISVLSAAWTPADAETARQENLICDGVDGEVRFEISNPVSKKYSAQAIYLKKSGGQLIQDLDCIRQR